MTLKVLGPDASLLEAHLPPGTGILARAGSALTLSPGVIELHVAFNPRFQHYL